MDGLFSEMIFLKAFTDSSFMLLYTGQRTFVITSDKGTKYYSGGLYSTISKGNKEHVLQQN